MNLFNVLFLPALAVTALLPVALPQPWLTRGLIAWVFSPAVLYVALAVGETFTGPDPAETLRLAFVGFSLMSAFVLVPWLAICAVGYGVGFGLRRLIRGPYVAPPPAPAPAPAAAPAATPPTRLGPSLPDWASLPATPGWRALHVGVSGDGVTVGGLPIWRHDWRRVPGASLSFPHPTHPAQRHDFEIYEIGEAADPARFAAGELSNGVWGIYVPTDLAAEERQGRSEWQGVTSPDGTIRVDVSPEEWGTAQWVAAPRVADLTTGQVVLNLWGASWDASPTFPAPRQVRLDLRRHALDGRMSVLLDLAAGTYRIVSEGGVDRGRPEGPLAAAAAALEAATHEAFVLAQRTPEARRPVAIAWRAGALIALGAAAAIATAAYVASRQPPKPTQALTPMPVMPDFTVPPRDERVPRPQLDRPVSLGPAGGAGKSRAGVSAAGEPATTAS